jgi:hypothetical protein
VNNHSYIIIYDVVICRELDNFYHFGILLEIGYYEILIISPKTVKSIDEIIVKKAKLINPKYPRSRILSSFL